MESCGLLAAFLVYGMPVIIILIGIILSSALKMKELTAVLITAVSVILWYILVKALEKYGSGCSGSRFLNGTLDEHIKLEKELAEFLNKEAVVTFSTGFQSNLGIISAIAGRNDYIVGDKENHASIYDACRLSYAKLLRYEHNDMEDLEKQLKSIPEDKGILIVTDGLFSMGGDIANLPEICRLAKIYGARVMVDDAHGLGVLGEHGRGTAEYWGLENEVDIYMGTFSKSFASIGGFIASDSDTINYLRHNSRSYIFSASLTPAATAAALASLHIMQDEPEHIERLWEVTRYALDGFRALGFEIGATETPIIPLYVRDMDKTFLVTRMLFDEGIFVNPVVPPACASGDTLIRFSLMATHTKRQVDYALEKMTKCFRKIGIL
jgi:8-amino-7-oxononanoate synthase